MKLVARDDDEHYVKLVVEDREDLWQLRHVIGPGDVLRAETRRTNFAGEKVACTLTLECEKTEYTGRWLRVTGEIREGPDDVEHGYHTFNLEEGKTFELWKPAGWKQYERDRVEKAVHAEKYKILICVIEKGEADFAVATEHGLQDAGSIDVNIPGKMYADTNQQETSFYGDVISVLQRNAGDVTHIIVAGPGFAKDNLYDTLEEEYPDIAGKTVVRNTSVTGERGIHEVLNRGAINDIVEESRLQDETQVFQEFLTQLNKNPDKAVYGLEQVKQAVEMGAVDTLLVADSNTTLQTVEAVMETVDERDGTVHILHEDHEPGERLKRMGGIAALLRYALPNI